MHIPHLRRLQAAAETVTLAPSILRLWDALESYAEICTAERVGLHEGGLDITGLPRFGGERPDWVRERGVDVILSWDETHVLCAMDTASRPGPRYRLVPRAA